MFYPDPFDFDGSGDLDFSEQAFRDEFLSDGFDDDSDADEDDFMDEE